MELDDNIHLNEYEIILSHILEIQENTAEFANRIETVLKEEELMFSWRINIFENYEMAAFKLGRMSIFWKKAAVFYEHKKQFLMNYNANIDIINSVNLINEIEKTITTLRPKIKKEEEVLMRMVKFFEEDYDTFREFLLILNMVITAREVDEDLRNKVEYFLENTKKLDSSARQILNMELKNKNF